MRRAASHLYPFAVLLLVCLSCRRTNPTMSPVDYVRYVETESSELRTKVQSGIWTYDFQYKPATYIALKEQDPRQLNRDTLAKRAALFDSTVWFNVTIKVGNGKSDPLKYHVNDLEEYNKRLDYFLVHAAKNFRLSYGNLEDVQQIGYHFENNYSMKPEVTAIIGFRIPDQSPVRPLTLSYYDELLNTGIIKIRIEEQVFRNTPSVTL